MTNIELSEEMAVAIMKALEDYLPVEDCGSFYSGHIVPVILSYLSKLITAEIEAAEREALEKAAEMVEEQEAALKRLAEIRITEGNIVPLAERIRGMKA